MPTQFRNVLTLIWSQWCLHWRDLPLYACVPTVHEIVTQDCKVTPGALVHSNACWMVKSDRNALTVRSVIGSVLHV